jgi:hypothetical protein
MKCGDTLNTTSPSGARSCRPTLYEVRRGGAAWPDDPGFEFRCVQENLLLQNNVRNGSVANTATWNGYRRFCPEVY